MSDRHTKGPGPWCGTAGGYSNHKCKCDACTTAWADARRDYMARNPEQRERHRARVAVWKANQVKETAS
jgi:uncharacterized protein YgiB involved in biofilm formation